MISFVIIIIIANLIVSIKCFQDNLFFNKYKFQIDKINLGEKYRLLTSGFLHADFMHLAFNMYALWLFGKIVLLNLGNFNFILIYVVSLLAGSFYSLKVHKDEPFYSAIGASGAVSGIIFSSILIYPQMKLMIFPIPINIPGYIFGIGYLIYSIYGMKNKIGNVGHAAHLGGAMGGYLLTLILIPSVFTQNKLIVGIMGLIIVGLLIFSKKTDYNK